MARETTSKNIDGITDLVVIAPIKEGFINAYENITYATRLRVVAEALNKIRISAREHEFVLPFSDVTERILTLLDFRIGVLDKDLLALEKTGRKFELKQRRYLYLTATFDTALEPYMRLIWDPLGPFLDLIFCNCEGYVTAGDNSCEDFLDWVRRNQMDSAIFYATTGNTINDDIYHGKVDRLLRIPDQRNRELAILQTSLRSPDEEAEDVRKLAMEEAQAGNRNKAVKLTELALEVLTVLFRLVDFFPPEWQFSPPKVLDHKSPASGKVAIRKVQPPKLEEGKYLARVAYSILHGWDPNSVKDKAALAYAEPLEWYKSAAKAKEGTIAPKAFKRPTQLDPEFKKEEVQAGIRFPLAPSTRPVRHGAMLLFTITDRETARAWLRDLPIHFEGSPDPEDGIYRSIAFTAIGLRQLGLDKAIVDQLPKEFREGMEARAGLIGDLRENHPRRWTLPRRAWSNDSRLPTPHVHLSEIDLVVQLRYAPPIGGDPAGRQALDDYVETLRKSAEASGLTLAAVEEMGRVPNPQDPLGEQFTDHFGFVDGVSQPAIYPEENTQLSAQSDTWSNTVRLGEVLAGYRNDRMDYAWDLKPLAKREKGERWHKWTQNAARNLAINGSFLVVRKLSQDVKAFNDTMEQAAAALSKDFCDISPDVVAAKIVGRNKDGTPLVPADDGSNAFDYEGDPHGSKCPFASHIRRTNPRRVEHGRPTPRILRRGMSYGKPYSEDPDGERGLIFMCYQSSISEQYEVVQRWINGGNSTGISSMQGDPLLGVGPKADKHGFGSETGQTRYFQFEHDNRVARVALPKPFASVEWGLYLFTPSRRALALLTKADPAAEFVMTDTPVDFNELRENSGRAMTDRLAALPANIVSDEWKRLLEDIDAKDPFELSLTPDIWSAIRWYRGGAMRLEAKAEPAPAEMAVLRNVAFKNNFDRLPKADAIELSDLMSAIASKASDNPAEIGPKAGSEKQPAVVIGGRKAAEKVLCDWKRYSVDEQLHRIENYSGAIYVTQQPDDKYKWYPELDDRYNYRKESFETNNILLTYTEKDGFDDGYEPAQKILAAARTASEELPHDPPLGYFKMELRRQFLMPALGAVCSRWFGIPGRLPFDKDDQDHDLDTIMKNGGWNWNTATNSEDPGGEWLRPAQCPGDCLAPSRGTFYPRPTPSISAYAADHGPAIRKAGEKFIDKYWDTATPPPGSVASAMFARMDDKAAVSRNLIGIMVGAMPPMDGNLRGILVEWLAEKTLWRHQAAYLRLRGAGKTPYEAAREALWRPMTRAMCKRPAPDLIYRQANSDDELDATGYDLAENIPINEGDLIVVGLVGVAQQSLRKADRDGDISIIFGGNRKEAWQGEYREDDKGEKSIPPADPVHACPAQDMAMGAMLGILAALLEAGQIEALPASLIVKIKELPQQAG